ncbi:MAG TPA: ATP-binding protein, partial [Pirellulales bacterium]|nr:ATP-binding protein [Pirellulales bacterium]
MNILPIALEDLVHARSIESARREFKKSWNDVIADAVFRTVCAFANDLQNLNGGYLVLGVDESEGLPILPPHGLDDLDVDLIQREIFGGCLARIDPEYQPVVAPEVFQGKRILVIWAPPGDARPYQAREHGGKGAAKYHYVRLASSTAAAKGDILTQLLQLTARI